MKSAATGSLAQASVFSAATSTESPVHLRHLLAMLGQAKPLCTAQGGIHNGVKAYRHGQTCRRLHFRPEFSVRG